MRRRKEVGDVLSNVTATIVMGKNRLCLTEFGFDIRFVGSGKGQMDAGASSA
jgi:hypothetical protein